MVHGTWYGVCGPVGQPAPTKFATKVVIVTYSPNTSCVPNLKVLASTIAEISRSPKLFRCSTYPHHPLFLALKVVFGKLHTVPKWYTKFELASFNGCRHK